MVISHWQNACVPKELHPDLFCFPFYVNILNLGSRFQSSLLTPKWEKNAGNEAVLAVSVGKWQIQLKAEEYQIQIQF